jgi:serine/threonine protein phosphatase 1
MRTIVIGDIHGCADELMELLDAASLVLMGNHERKHVRRVYSTSQEITRLQIGEGYEDAVAWMGGLPYFYETDEVRVVHWGFVPGTPLADVPEDMLSGTTSGSARLEELCGGRPWYESYIDEKPVVFGHAVVGPEPLVRDDRVYGIDTGACHGMRLTALVLPDRRIVSVPARDDHWKATRDRWQMPLLRAQPWPTMTFDQIAKRLKKVRRDPEQDASAVDPIERWAEDVRARIARLAIGLDELTERLVAEHGEDGFPRAAGSHAAGRWLLPFRAGRLSRQHLGCSSPREVFDLADALEISLDMPPSP